MSHLVANAFSSYELTDEEALQGAILTITQKQVIQNQLAALAEEKIHLEPDPANMMLYVGEEAYLRGQIVNLQYLLQLSATAEEEFIQQQQNPQY